MPQADGAKGEKIRWKHDRLTQCKKTNHPLGLATEPLEGGHLLDDLTDIGATKLLADVGEVSLDWQDIWYYHLATGRVATVTERRILKELSEAFTMGKYEGLDPLNISPAERTPTED